MQIASAEGAHEEEEEEEQQADGAASANARLHPTD